MKIKKGDKVQVIAGQDKGTVGEVLAAFPRVNKVIVEGVNVCRKHQKPNNVNPDGGMIDKECPINASNVKLAEKGKSAKKKDKKSSKKDNKKEDKKNVNKKGGKE